MIYIFIELSFIFNTLIFPHRIQHFQDLSLPVYRHFKLLSDFVTFNGFLLMKRMSLPAPKYLLNQ